MASPMQLVNEHTDNRNPRHLLAWDSSRVGALASLHRGLRLSRHTETLDRTRLL